MGSRAATGPIGDDLLGEQGLLRLRLPLVVEDGLAVGVGHRLVVLDRLHDRDVRVRGEVQGHPLPHEHGGCHHREGQQHPERRAGHVHPEVAEQGRALAGQAPDERDADGEAGGSGQEVLGREADDLAQVAHRRLAAVRLPGRRGREADRRVHREVGSERPRPVRRVERVEERLHPQHRVQQQRPAEAESDEAPGIALPVHLGRRGRPRRAGRWPARADACTGSSQVRSPLKTRAR